VSGAATKELAGTRRRRVRVSGYRVGAALHITALVSTEVRATRGAWRTSLCSRGCTRGCFVPAPERSEFDFAGVRGCLRRLQEVQRNGAELPRPGEQSIFAVIVREVGRGCGVEWSGAEWNGRSQAYGPHPAVCGGGPPEAAPGPRRGPDAQGRSRRSPSIVAGARRPGPRWRGTAVGRGLLIADCRFRIADWPSAERGVRNKVVGGSRLSGVWIRGRTNIGGRSMTGAVMRRPGCVPHGPTTEESRSSERGAGIPKSKTRDGGTTRAL